MKPLLGCLALGILFFSCVEDETPDNPVQLDGKLNITVAPGYPSGAIVYWVVVHDLEGNPVGHGQMEPGETMTLELDDSKRYHLTTYRRGEYSGFQMDLLETYSDLAVAEDMTLGLSPSLIPDPAFSGTFQVDVLESEQPYAAYLTSSVGGQNFSANQFENRLEMTMNRFEGIDDYLLVVRKQTGETRYKMLKVTGPDTKLSYRFSDLSAFDKVFKFKKSDFSQFYFTSVAVRQVNGVFKSGYIVNSNRIGNGFDPLLDHELGFLNGIEYYDITISGKRSLNSKTNFSYRRFGPVPASITLPVEHTVQAQSQTLSDFRFTKPAGITNWTSVWDQSGPVTGEPFKSLRWVVIGTDASLKLRLPDELIALNPKLQDLGKFKLETIHTITHSHSYDEQMRGKFVEIPKTQAIESATITQSFL